MTAREIRCKGCGTLNRVPSYSIRKRPQCGKCHAALPEAQSVTILRRFHALPLAVWGGLLFFGGTGVVAYITNGTSSGAVSAAPTPVVAPCTPVDPLTIGNIMRIYDADQPQPSVTHWTIHAGIGADYFVKLISASTGVPKISYYVRGGSSAETDVPTGAYVIKHASGSIWCGEGQYFGPNTVFQKGDRTVSFDEGHTYTLYLTPMRNGNFPTTLISRSQF